MKVSAHNRPFTPVNITIESTAELEAVIKILRYGSKKRPQKLRVTANDLLEKLKEVAK